VIGSSEKHLSRIYDAPEAAAQIAAPGMGAGVGSPAKALQSNSSILFFELVTKNFTKNGTDSSVARSRPNLNSNQS
jgi:hypothetical protein